MDRERRADDADGAPARLADHARRTALQLSLVAVNMLPGPILGFVFGGIADPGSLIALVLGLVWKLWVCVPNIRTGVPSPLDTWSRTILGRRL